LTAQLHIVPTLRICGVIPLLPYMRSWSGWELALCLSLHFNLAIQRGTAVVGCSMNMAHISIQSVAPHQSDQNTRITARFRRKKGMCYWRCDRPDVSGNYIIVRMFIALHFSHQLPPPIHNTNSTTQCFGVYEQRCGVLSKRQGS